MKHHEPEQLKTLARIGQEYPQLMPCDKRRQRWVELLEGNPGTGCSRHCMRPNISQRRCERRCNNSAISVAFSDPLLRAAGLENDTYGEAKRFFELSASQLHRIVCSCHFGEKVSAAKVARYIRAKHSDRGQGIWGRLLGIFAWILRSRPLNSSGRTKSGSFGPSVDLAWAGPQPQMGGMKRPPPFFSGDRRYVAPRVLLSLHHLIADFPELSRCSRGRLN